MGYRPSAFVVEAPFGASFSIFLSASRSRYHLLVFWFLSRIGRYGRDRPMPPWLSRSRKKARVVAPFFNSRQSPNSCLGRSYRLRARTRKVGRAEASR